MKRFPIAAALSLAATAASAQFQGVADFQVTINTERGKPMLSTGKVYLAPSAYRMEWETDLSAMRGRRGAENAPKRMKMTMLARQSDPERLFMVNDENKTYSVMDLKEIRENAAKMRNPEATATYTVQKLGRDSVAGLPCQNALITSSAGMRIEVCVAKEITGSSSWIAGFSRHASDSQSWVKALRDNGLEGFPVRMVMRRKDATEPTMTMALTRLERKSVPASVFEVPAGYRQTDFVAGGLTPEQEKAVSDARVKMREALEKMTPEQRKAYEDAMRRYGNQPPPTPKDR